jgi:hypothetical protein
MSSTFVLPQKILIINGFTEDELHNPGAEVDMIASLISNQRTTEDEIKSTEHAVEQKLTDMLSLYSLYDIINALDEIISKNQVPKLYTKDVWQELAAAKKGFVCWECSVYFIGVPFFNPVGEIANSALMCIKTEGCFCSTQCLDNYCKSITPDATKLREKRASIKYIYSDFPLLQTSLVSKFSMKKYGGHLSQNEYCEKVRGTIVTTHSIVGASI